MVRTRHPAVTGKTHLEAAPFMAQPPAAACTHSPLLQLMSRRPDGRVMRGDLIGFVFEQITTVLIAHARSLQGS